MSTGFPAKWTGATTLGNEFFLQPASDVLPAIPNPSCRCPTQYRQSRRPIHISRPHPRWHRKCLARSTKDPLVPCPKPWRRDGVRRWRNCRPQHTWHHKKPRTFSQKQEFQDLGLESRSAKPVPQPEYRSPRSFAEHKGLF